MLFSSKQAFQQDFSKKGESKHRSGDRFSSILDQQE
jgi:hypothetical protein